MRSHIFACCLLLALGILLSAPQFSQAEVQFRGFQAALASMDQDALDSLDGEWGTNVVKFQLGDNANQDSISNMDDYRSMMETALAPFDDLLPTICDSNMKVVITLLSPPGGFVNRIGGNETDGVPHDAIFSYEWAQQGYLEYIAELAERYEDSPCILGLELLNEPAEDPARTNPALKGWNELIPDAVAAVRAAAPSTRIFAKPLFANVDLMKKLPIEAIEAANGDGILYYVFNYYPDLDYAHAGLSGIDINTPAPSEKSIEKKYCTTIAAFLETFDTLYSKNLVTRSSPPLWMGETGFTRWASGGAAYFDNLLSVFEGEHCSARAARLKKNLRKKIRATRDRGKKKRLRKKRKALRYQTQADNALAGWNVHAFRESTIWSFEHSDDPDDATRYPFGSNPSERDNVLASYFSRNSS